MAGRYESKEEQFQMELVRAAWARSCKAFATAKLEMRLFSQIREIREQRTGWRNSISRTKRVKQPWLLFRGYYFIKLITLWACVNSILHLAFFSPTPSFVTLPWNILHFRRNVMDRSLQRGPTPVMPDASSGCGCGCSEILQKKEECKPVTAWALFPSPDCKPWL